MPTWLQALILGIVQGLTEFVPVSSSAHLVLVPAYFGWQRPGIAFDVALHVGTLVALLVYYRVDLYRMARAVVSRQESAERWLYRRLAGLLALATVPVAAAGLGLRTTVELAFESPQLASGLLLGTAVLLVTGEQVRRRRVARARSVGTTADDPAMDHGDVGADPSDPTGTDLTGLRNRQAVVIGLGQALALLPGLSRSGTTITAGMVAGLTRPAATRFAFLLSLPAIAGATVVSLPELTAVGYYSGTDIVVGMVAAAVAGYLAITGLVRLVSRASLERFVIYLVVVAVVGLVAFSS